MALIFGLIYLRLEYNQEGEKTQFNHISTIFLYFFFLIGVQNINGVIFLILTNTTFGNLFPVLNSFPKGTY